MASWISSIGLILDIIGVLFVFKYGLPEVLDRQGRGFLLLEGTDDAEAAKARHYDRMARIGLFLIIAGFVLQLIGNWLK